MVFFERAVVDFHPEKFALRRPAAIGALPADAQLVAIHIKLEVLALQPRQLHLTTTALPLT